MHTLDYLDFDYSEDAEGVGTWDALACVPPDRLPAVQAEAAQLLDWARRTFPGGQGPCEEGGAWDCDLHTRAEADGRVTLALSISGSPAFGEALRAAFGL
ncbi:MAG: hypothetical protein QM740_11865 [Acidovorax sp.]